MSSGPRRQQVSHGVHFSSGPEQKCPGGNLYRSHERLHSRSSNSDGCLQLPLPPLTLTLNHPINYLDSKFSLLDICSLLSCVVWIERTISGQRRFNDTGVYKNISASRVENNTSHHLASPWGLLTAWPALRPADMVYKHPDLPQREMQGWHHVSEQF